MSTEASAARTIDAHHHLWDLSVREQAWTAGLPVLRRTYTMDELHPLLAAAGVDGTVLVETINVAAETQELLAVAASDPVVRGVVGWVDLTAADVAEAIARLRELPVAIEAVDQVPQGRFVLDHLGKPPIATGTVEPWATNVKQLAVRDNVACKLSGMVTEASPSWSVADLDSYAVHVLSAFGPDRVMAGSDWPVCLLRAGYQQVWRANEELVSSLSADERSAVLGGTATTWYGLS